jgi:hypothetical protein
MTKFHNLSQHFAQTLKPLRQALDQAGGTAKTLVRALDVSS